MDNLIKISYKLLIIIILLITLSYTIYSRCKIINDLTSFTQQQTEIYLSNIAREKISKIPNILYRSDDISNLKSNQDFTDLMSYINSLKSKSSIIEINIYNSKGINLDINNDSKIINFFEYNRSISYIESLAIKFNNIVFIKNKQVSKEKPYNILIPNAAYKSSNQIIKSSLIKIVIPIDVQNDGVMDLFIELYVDISDIWNDLFWQNITIFIMLSLSTIFFYLIFLIPNNKIQKLVENLHEQNMELNEAKIKAEQASTEKSKFLANVSHELRTPLNAIIGFSEIIKTEAMGPIENPQYKDYINDINNSGTHLLSLINDILDYSKAEAEKLEVDAIEVDLTKIMITSMRFLKPRAEEAKVKLIENFPKEHIVLVADPKRLKQALLNILSNSVKFTPEGGSITLSAVISESDKTISILVKDTGIGIAEKDIPRAMASFGQVDNKLSRRYAGTGLGLPLTKKLVELMGGNFQLQSEVGFGTTVTITFPYNK